MNFRTIFCNLRKEKNLSQLDIAKKTGFAKTTICAWEKGRAQPSLDTLVKLANIFNCSVDYLLGREDEFGIIQSNSELAPVETQLLSLFRNLNERDQNKVLGYVQALAY